MGGTRCIAPKCNVGYDSNKEKVHKFSVPKCPEKRQKWQRALKRDNIVLKAGQVVCQKHFLSEDIRWGWEAKGANGKVIKHEYKVPRLKDDALPSQFPGCPQYLSQTRKRRKSPKKRDFFTTKTSKIRRTLVLEEAEVSVHSKEAKKPTCSKEAEMLTCSKKAEMSTRSKEAEMPTRSKEAEMPTCSKEAEMLTCSKEAEESILSDDKRMSNSLDEQNKIVKSELNKVDDETTAVFKSMFSNDTSVACPLPWTRQTIYLGDSNKIQFVHWASSLINGKCRPMCHKQLVVSSDLSINLFVNGQSFDVEKIGLENSISSPMDLSTILNKLNNLKVCSGCANPSEDINFVTSFAARDENGHLRHKECCLLIAGNLKLTRCKSCNKGRNTLMRKKERLKDRNCVKLLKNQMSPLSIDKYRLTQTQHTHTNTKT